MSAENEERIKKLRIEHKELLLSIGALRARLDQYKMKIADLDPRKREKHLSELRNTEKKLELTLEILKLDLENLSTTITNLEK